MFKPIWNDALEPAAIERVPGVCSILDFGTTSVGGGRQQQRQRNNVTAATANRAQQVRTQPQASVTSNLPTAPWAQDLNQGAEAVEQATFQRGMNRLQPQFDRQQDRLQTRLANQGLTLNSEAYKTAVGDQLTAQNEAMSNLALDSVAAGRAEQSRLFGLGSQGRQQALAEALTERSLPLSELQALSQIGQGERRLDIDQLNAMTTADLAERRLGLDAALGMGQLGQGDRRLDIEESLGQGRLGLDESRLALDEALGLGSLGVQQGQLGLAQDRLAFDQEMGRDRLALDETLGLGGLGVQQDRLALDEALGLGGLDVQRDRLALDELLGTGRLDLDAELGRGQLNLGRDELNEQGRQFNQQLTFDARTRQMDNIFRNAQFKAANKQAAANRKAGLIGAGLGFGGDVIGAGISAYPWGGAG